MPWLLPVRLDECAIPDLDIGGGRTLASIQRVDLFGDRYDEQIARLVATVLRILAGSPGSAGPGVSAGAERYVLLRTGFPAGIDDRRAAAASLLLVGVSMSRTVQGGSLTGLRRVLESGGKIRVLLVDPTEDALVRAAGDRRPQGSAEWVRRHIEFTLEDLANLRDSTGGDVEFRVARFVPAMAIHAIDTGRTDGLIVLQYYEHKPAGEPGPILVLRAADGFWYKHFAAEAERLWDDGLPWPPPAAEALRQSPRPLFTQEFGPELEQNMDSARDMLITGVTRNTLLFGRYMKFEQWLRNGCAIRILLMNPSSDAIATAAERYYAERSQESTRYRIQQTLRLLTELKHTTGGNLTVRLTPHPLAIGTIAIDAAPGTRSAHTALFAEYYTYQAPGEPKFVLQPADGPWFENLYQEAEALWKGATDANLNPAT